MRARSRDVRANVRPLKTRSRISFTRKVRPSVLVTLSIFGSQIAGAENGGELAEAVNALVVHLDDDDAFESGEDFFQAVRQRMDVAQMQRADLSRHVRARVSPRRGSARRSNPSRRAACRLPDRHKLPAPEFPRRACAVCCGVSPSSPCATSGCRSDGPSRRARVRRRADIFRRSCGVPGAACCVI